MTGLTNGTAYTFRVRAVNSIGESDASTEATATPSPDPDPDPEPEPEPVPALPLLGQLLLALVLRKHGPHCRLARMAGARGQTRTVRCMVRVIHGFSSCHRVAQASLSRRI